MISMNEKSNTLDDEVRKNQTTKITRLLEYKNLVHMFVNKLKLYLINKFYYNLTEYFSNKQK